MPHNVLDLLAPTAVVHAEGFEATPAWELVETRLDDAQQGSRRDPLQRKLDETGALSRWSFRCDQSCATSWLLIDVVERAIKRNR
jgi:hypothetical protein